MNTTNEEQAILDACYPETPFDSEHITPRMQADIYLELKREMEKDDEEEMLSAQELQDMFIEDQAMLTAARDMKAAGHPGLISDILEELGYECEPYSHD